MSAPNVYVRLRPAQLNEQGNEGLLSLLSDDKTVSMAGTMSGMVEKAYGFDGHFAPSVSQREVFEKVGQPLVDHALNGFSATLMCYGQTGTGKSYTMCNTKPGEEGLVQRCTEYLFNQIRENSKFHNMKITTQFVQIYQKQMQDLYDAGSTIDVTYDKVLKKVLLKNCTTKEAKSTQAVLNQFEEGLTHRKVKKTKMNETSSRGHVVFILGLECELGPGSAQCSLLTFVDLAGYENFEKTGVKNDKGLQDECKCINSSLFSLGSVAQALSLNQSHVPWRESVLSQLLQDKMGGNAMTTIILTCGPCLEYRHETGITLTFGSTCKAIKVDARMAVKKDPKRYIDFLEVENQKLMDQISKDRLERELLQQKNSEYEETDTSVKALQESLTGKEEEIANLQEELAKQVMGGGISELEEKENHISFLSCDMTRAKARHSEDVERLTKQLSGQDKQIAELEGLIESYKAKCEQSSVNNEIESLKREKMELEQQLQTLERESIRLQKSINEERQARDHKVAELELTIATVEAEKEAVRHDANAKCREVADITEKYITVDRNLKDLMDQIGTSGVSQQRAEEAENKQTQLEAVVTELHEQCESLKSQLQSQQEELSQCKASSEETERLFTAQQHTLLAEQQAVAQLKVEIGEAKEASVEQLQRNQKTHEEQIEGEKNKQKHVTQRLVETERMLAEINSELEQEKQAYITEHKNNVELQRKIVELQLFEEQNTELQKSTEELTTQTVQLQDELQQKDFQIQKLSQAYTNELAEKTQLQQDVEQLKVTSENAASLETAQQQTAEENQQLQQEVQQKDDQIEKYQREIDDWKEKCENLQKELQTEQEVNAEAINALQQSLNNKNQELSAVALQCKKNIEALQDGVDKMKTDYEKRLNEVGHQAGDQLETISDLRDINSNLKQDLQHANAMRMEHEELINSLQEQMLQTKNSNAEMEAIIKEWQHKLMAQENVTKDLEMQLNIELEGTKKQFDERFQTANAEMLQKLQAAQQETQEAQHQVDLFNKQFQCSKEDLEQQELHSQSQQQEVHDLAKDLEYMKKQHDISLNNELLLRTKYHSLETKHCKYVTDMEKLLAQQINTSRNVGQKVEEHSKELNKLQSAYEEVASERDALLERTEALERDLRVTAHRFIEEQSRTTGGTGSVASTVYSQCDGGSVSSHGSSRHHHSHSNPHHHHRSSHHCSPSATNKDRERDRDRDSYHRYCREKDRESLASSVNSLTHSQSCHSINTTSSSHTHTRDRQSLYDVPDQDSPHNKHTTHQTGTPGGGGSGHHSRHHSPIPNQTTKDSGNSGGIGGFSALKKFVNEFTSNNNRKETASSSHFDRDNREKERERKQHSHSHHLPPHYNAPTSGSPASHAKPISRSSSGSMYIPIRDSTFMGNGSGAWNVTSSPPSSHGKKHSKP